MKMRMAVVVALSLLLLVLAGCYSKQSTPATRPAVNPQITLDLLRSYFCRPGSERFTSAQVARIWEEQFKGQRVRWVGTVRNVGEIEFYEGRAVDLQCDGACVYVHVEPNQALRLNIGQRVVVEGTLRYDFGTSWDSYYLEDTQVW